MKQSNSLSKKAIHQQKRFIEALEGLGDILVFQTEGKKNRDVIRTLADLSDLLKMLLSLRKTNLKKFDQLMLDREYWKFLKKDKKEAELRLSFYPKKYLVTFSLLLQQLIRVFETALKFENEEIIRQSSYELVFFLTQVSSMAKADLLVTEILKRLWEFSRKTLAIKSIAAHSSTYHWYSDIIFGNLGKSKIGFQYEYLPLFNRYFFENIKFLISEGKLELFKQLIGHLVGIHIPDYTIHKVWDYDDSLASQDREKYLQISKEHRIGNKIQILDDTAKRLYSTEKLDEWLKLFDEMKGVIYPLLNKKNKTKATKLEKKIKDAAYKCYANQSLVEVIFYAGAWAVYKNRPEFILEIWTHKQPDDAAASYGGNDIFPQNIKETINFYFEQSIKSFFGFFWENHHGSERYEKTYFLLLILKHLKAFKPYIQNGIEEEIGTQRFSDIENFVLPFNDPYKLSDVRFVAEGLLVIAEELKHSSLPRDLKLAGTQSETEELVSERLIPFLQRVIQNADEKLQSLKTEQPLSSAKIVEFKESVFSSYIQSATIRKLLEEVGKLKDKVSARQIVTNNLRGFNQIQRREAFFEEWNVDYGDLGKEYGGGVAEGEDFNLVQEITQLLPATDNKSIQNALSRIAVGEKSVIFVSHDFMYEFLESDDDFIPYWKENPTEKREAYLEGYLQFNGVKIKVYKFKLKSTHMYFAVFNLDTVGELVQYYPLIEDDVSDDLVQHLRVKVQDFSTSEDLLEKFLNKPPSWLIEQGTKEQQKDYLRQFTLLHIGVKVEFFPDKAPQGFIYIESEEK